MTKELVETYRAALKSRDYQKSYLAELEKNAKAAATQLAHCEDAVEDAAHAIAAQALVDDDNGLVE